MLFDEMPIISADSKHTEILGFASISQQLFIGIRVD